MSDSHKPVNSKPLRLATLPVAPLGHRAASNLPPDLTAVIDAWPDLPEPIRAGIVAMVKAASGTNRA